MYHRPNTECSLKEGVTGERISSQWIKARHYSPHSSDSWQCLLSICLYQGFSTCGVRSAWFHHYTQKFHMKMSGVVVSLFVYGRPDLYVVGVMGNRIIQRKPMQTHREHDVTFLKNSLIWSFNLKTFLWWDLKALYLFVYLCRRIWIKIVKNYYFFCILSGPKCILSHKKNKKCRAFNHCFKL